MSNSKFSVMKELVRTYQDLASHLKPIQARVLADTSGIPETRQIVVRSTQRNLEKNENTTIENLYQVTKAEGGEVMVQNLSTTDVTSELYSQYSPSSLRKCVIRVVPDGGKKKQFLEIWDNGRLIHDVDLNALDLHEDIHPPGDFGCVEWSPDELMVAYIAEKKRIKPEPFFSTKPQAPPADGEAFPYGEEYTAIEDWGEQMTDVSQTVIVLYDMSNVHVLDVIPEGWCPGEFIWDVTAKGLYGVAHNNEPRLGITSCTNRESHLFYYSLGNELDFEVTGKGISVRSPRLSPDGQYLVWLQRPANGPHDSCYAMMRMDTGFKEIVEIVPIADKEITNNGQQFTGLYLDLPRNCFSNNGWWVWVSTVFYNDISMFTVTIETGNLSYHGDGLILGVTDDQLLCIRGEPTEFPFIFLYSTSGVQFNVNITEQLTAVENVEVKAETITFPLEDVDFDTFNTVLLKPSSSTKKLPLIVL